MRWASTGAASPGSIRANRMPYRIFVAYRLTPHTTATVASTATTSWAFWRKASPDQALTIFSNVAFMGGFDSYDRVTRPCA